MCRCDIENEDKVIKIELLLSLVQLVFMCKFDETPLIGSGDRVQTSLTFTVLIVCGDLEN